MKRDPRETLADITLLFELSLAVGTSLELEENCRRFLTTLMARKNLDLAAVWLRDASDGEPHPEAPYRLAYAAPAAHVGARVVAADHPLVARLRGGRAFSAPDGAPEVAGLFGLGGGAGGVAAAFPLGAHGFIGLHSSFEGSLAEGRELRQLEGVTEKFAVSVGGCIAHAQAVREIAERKKAEVERAEIREQLHHAQKMEAVGRLAGGVAHDFNNLLTAILGCAELLRQSSITSQDQRFVDTITRASRSAADLTSQLLVFSRRGGVDRKLESIEHIVAQTVALLRRTVGPQITLLHDCRLGSSALLLTNASQLQNALLNLGVNARDAIEGEGTIRFSTSHVLRDAGTGPTSFVCIEVSDTGAGMDDATRARIFEPFFSTKESGRGTGLGLAAVYGTITSHEGAISVRSEPGVGTTFEVLLPLAEAEAKADSERPQVAAGSGRVLLVDDDEQARLVLEQLCLSLGYTVVAVESGERALRHLERSLPDVVLLDVRLAGMSGPETLAELRADHPELPVVAMSGFADMREFATLKELGVHDFLEKPFTRATLASCLSSALEAGSTSERG